MQYGVDISTYKRVENNKKKKEIRVQGTAVGSIVVFIMGFLLSRVILSATINMGIAPFGIAYLIGVKKRKWKGCYFIFIRSYGRVSIYKF